MVMRGMQISPTASFFIIDPEEYTDGFYESSGGSVRTLVAPLCLKQSGGFLILAQLRWKLGLHPGQKLRVAGVY